MCGKAAEADWASEDVQPARGGDAGVTDWVYCEGDGGRG
jgi:hypothetical protein